MKPRAQFGAAVDGALYSYRNGRVGAILIDGPIIPRATMFSDVSGVMSIDRLTDEFKAFVDNPEIEEIVLLLDTPGGDVTGISDFSALVRATEKPVSAFAWMAASAGYWIASAADSIVAPVSGMIGSIGVVVTYYDYTEADAKKGVRAVEMVSSQSPNKRADINTDTGRAVVQQLLDDLADGFIGAVAMNRGTDAETVINTYGGGAVFAAPRAMDAGMIDHVSDFDSFMKAKTGAEGGRTLPGFARKGISQMSEVQETPAVVAETVDLESALKAERDRIKGIESLAGSLDGSHPAVVAAAKEEIDRIKYDPAFNKENAAVNVLSVVSKAQNGLVETLADSKKEVTEAAEKIAKAEAPESTEEENKKAEAANIARLQAAREEV